MSSPKLDPYLTFNDNCAEAFKFYATVLGAQIEALMTFANSPMGAQMPAAEASKIIHARMVINGQVVMASDSPPGVPYPGMSGFSLSLNYDSIAKANEVFAALAEGGKISMPFGQTFWAAAFGMVTDRFGVPWMVGCEKEA